MNPYQLSKNYYQLWDLVCQSGSPEIVCFVDYNPRIGNTTYRDVCVCKKNIDNGIIFKARGISYGDAPFTAQRPKNGIWQRDRFMNECRRMNVEFIIPPQTEVQSPKSYFEAEKF